ncbi:MAG: hypothetical protein DRN88_00325 [Candidatus Hydrothermarchaeota archaeon]|nr:MAG: hypothetical protein DRN88_00325 [Candidatus Hydrothermarchaeota archaeon]
MLALEYLPYKPRPFQDELIDRIFTSEVMLCDVPTGVGKSVASLCGFLGDRLSNEKVVVLTRTKSQARIFLKETAGISKKIKKPLLALHLKSKQEFCPLYSSEITYEEFAQLCKLNKECEHRKKFLEFRSNIELLADRISLSREYENFDLFNYGCPYLILQELLPYADVVIASYNYLLHPFMRDTFLLRLGKSLEELLVIVDEAHNLSNLDLVSRSLSRKTVKLACKELNQRLSFLSAFEGEDERLNLLDFVSLDEILSLYERGVEILKRKKISFTFRTASFLLNVYKLRRDENWIFFRQEKRLFLKPVFPFKLIEPLKQCRKLLFMSGTLSPIEGYKILFGLEKAETYEMPSIFPIANRLYMGIKQGLNTKLEQRNERLWEEYAKIIEEIYKATPQTTLVFFPSYEILSVVTEHLPYSIKEPKENRELPMFIKNVKNKDKKLVLAVCGGKLSEGVEFVVNGKSIIKTIIIAGFPFPVPNFEMELRKELYDEAFGYGKGFFLLWVLPMINKVQQAIGRAIRSERDKASIVFLDDRIEYFKYFPDEISHNLELCDIDEIPKEVRRFHAR